MKKPTIEQQELLQQMIQGNDLREITPFKALETIRKQVGNIHVFTDEMPPRQTSIELRNSGLFEIIEQALKEHERYKVFEEKLGMPLDKFLEWRLNSLIPYCVIEGKVKKVAHYNWLVERNIIEVWDANYRQRYKFHLKDYGKTWALTKEELL